MVTLSRIAAAGAIAVSANLALAQGSAEPPCITQTGSQESCVPLVGCLGVDGDYFTGRALGWNAGAFVGTSQGNLACHGEWTARNALGLGQAKIICEDGVSGVAFFTSQDGATGTATGHGALSDGRPLRVWSGHNIHQFIIQETGDVNARLMCGDIPVPIG